MELQWWQRGCRVWPPRLGVEREVVGAVKHAQHATHAATAPDADLHHSLVEIEPLEFDLELLGSTRPCQCPAQGHV